MDVGKKLGWPITNKKMKQAAAALAKALRQRGNGGDGDEAQTLTTEYGLTE